MKCPNCGQVSTESRAGWLCASCGHLEPSNQPLPTIPVSPLVKPGESVIGTNASDDDTDDNTDDTKAPAAAASFPAATDAAARLPVASLPNEPFGTATTLAAPVEGDHFMAVEHRQTENPTGTITDTDLLEVDKALANVPDLLPPTGDEVDAPAQYQLPAAPVPAVAPEPTSTPEPAVAPEPVDPPKLEHTTAKPRHRLKPHSVEGENVHHRTHAKPLFHLKPEAPAHEPTETQLDEAKVAGNASVEANVDPVPSSAVHDRINLSVHRSVAADIKTQREADDAPTLVPTNPAHDEHRPEITDHTTEVTTEPAAEPKLAPVEAHVGIDAQAVHQPLAFSVTVVPEPAPELDQPDQADYPEVAASPTPELEPEPELEPDSQLEPESQSQPEPEFEPQSQPQPGPEPQLDAEPQPGPEPQPDAEAQLDAEDQPDAEAETNADPIIEDLFEPAAEVQAVTGLGATTEVVEDLPLAEPDPDPDPDPEPDPEPAADQSLPPAPDDQLPAPEPDAQLEPAPVPLSPDALIDAAPPEPPELAAAPAESDAPANTTLTESDASASTAPPEESQPEIAPSEPQPEIATPAPQPETSSPAAESNRRSVTPVTQPRPLNRKVLVTSVIAGVLMVMVGVTIYFIASASGGSSLFATATPTPVPIQPATNTPEPTVTPAASPTPVASPAVTTAPVATPAAGSAARDTTRKADLAKFVAAFAATASGGYLPTQPAAVTVPSVDPSTNAAYQVATTESQSLGVVSYLAGHQCSGVTTTPGKLSTKYVAVTVKLETQTTPYCLNVNN